MGAVGGLSRRPEVVLSIELRSFRQENFISSGIQKGRTSDRQHPDRRSPRLLADTS
ncbi:hypothetical protein XHV734_0845 [Xanthomonas hortorum pv. vitians]|nr:hypothetical protein XHV734_0845 [Xanthomonas hortorum pv. vitians]